MHPRLFHSVILIEPTISMKALAWPVPIARLATFMPDRWDSKETAEEKLLARPYYKFWEPRVKEILKKHALRQLPTPLYPETAPDTYTLKTPKHVEVFNVARQNYDSIGVNSEVPIEQKIAFPDMHPRDSKKAPFYRAEARTAFLMLPELRPSCLFLFGSKSSISTDWYKRDVLEATGTGYLGSGGVRMGRVEGKTILAGHSVPQENVNGTADVVADW